jgi:hypothetical protein
MILRYLLATLLLALACPPAFADTASAPTADTLSAQEFLAWHDDVARRASGKDFEALSRGDKDNLRNAQALIRAALAGKASLGELDAATQASVYEAHQQVVALVNKAEDERLVCTQRKQIGSNRRIRECRTVAQIRADREAARDARLRPGVCNPGRSDCGGG